MVGDVVVVNIIRWAEKITRLVTIYDYRDGETGESPARIVHRRRMIQQGGWGTVLEGDFHAHSQRWDPRCSEQRVASHQEEIIDEHGLVIGNDDRPTHYRMRHNSIAESFIDLTLAN